MFKRSGRISRLSKGSWLFALLFILFMENCLPVSAAPRVQAVEGPIVIVIDPGHGGNNKGTQENGFCEKESTLKVANAMYEELCQYDNVEVYLTRTEDVDITLEDRAKFAASVDADFLFSIHFNASLSHEMFGTEVWVSSFAPYNAYGYQFGALHTEALKEEMGLFSRGVKTRIGDKNLDYYGIIRESVSRSVPAVIIEHCHVDEARDAVFCDSDEDLIAFGKMDALSVAKYFGLKSSALGVDYSQDSLQLAEAEAGKKAKPTYSDTSIPDVCHIELVDADYGTGDVTIEITAADYDSALIYYSYSIDGGKTYSSLHQWPESDALAGTYQDTFTTVIQIPTGEKPQIKVRAYNAYDLNELSNTISFNKYFQYDDAGDEQYQNPPQTDLPAEGSPIENSPAEDSPAGHSLTAEPSVQEADSVTGDGIPDNTDTQSIANGSLDEAFSLGTTTFQPDVLTQEEQKEVGLLGFLTICLIIVAILFVVVLITQIVMDYKRRKRRRQYNQYYQYRNDSEDNTYHMI